MKRKNSRRLAQMRAKPAPRKTKSNAAKAAAKRIGAKTRPKSLPKSSRQKVRAYRERMRAKGLRLVQMWVPDTRTPEFAAEAVRQSLLANASRFAAEDQGWVDTMSDWKTD